MSRPTHTERGARIAAWQADEMLRAHFTPDMFPRRLSKREIALWQGIRDAAAAELADARVLSEARAHG